MMSKAQYDTASEIRMSLGTMTLEHAFVEIGNPCN